MVAAASSPRARLSETTVRAGAHLLQRKARRSAATWILMAIPILMVTLFAWQIASPLLRTETVIRDAVGFSRVSLEADPAGSRIDFAVVDRVGRETTVNGDVNISLREPDGTVWQTTRSITAANFATLPEGGLLAGRHGYSVVVPASDWSRAPRRGGAATVSVSVQPTEGTAFSTVAEERFP